MTQGRYLLPTFLDKNKIPINFRDFGRQAAKAFFLFLILILFVFNYSPAYACTAFMMADGERVLVGNNEDYNIPYTRVWFVPSENGRYGRVCFGYDNWSPQGGMNDQGLFLDFFATKSMQVKQSKSNSRFWM